MEQKPLTSEEVSRIIHRELTDKQTKYGQCPVPTINPFSGHEFVEMKRAIENALRWIKR